MARPWLGEARPVAAAEAAAPGADASRALWVAGGVFGRWGGEGPTEGLAATGR
jgi:hypothetical protein